MPVARQRRLSQFSAILLGFPYVCNEERVADRLKFKEVWAGRISIEAQNLLLSILRKLPPHHHAERRKVLPCFCRRDPSGIAYEPFCCLDRIGRGQTSCRPAVN